ncbi:MAG TPA: hypothetical protein VJK72_05380 [Candidatus Nanoarchaeia archaeon]|nr:hypothetical protein [Candidatus Nanoarchaeia archaeon]
MRWLLLLLLLGCTQQEPFINIGVLLDNDAALSGMELAVKEINQRDFLDSPLRLVVKDCTTAGALELILAHGARVLIDACTEDVASRVAEQNRAAVISLYHSGMFSLQPSVLSLDKATAHALVQQGYSRIGVLRSRDIDVFVGEVQSLGSEVISEYVERNASHATQQRARLLASKPDALFVVDVNDSVVKNFDTIPIFTYITSEHLTVRPAVSDVFSTYFQKVYGKQPTYDAGLGYDAVKSIAEALRNAPHSGKAIAEELQRMSFEGASGVVEFDRDRTILVSFDIKTADK